jgi:hypothetical protein
MSTKTIYKRIALVTIAALGFGMHCVVPTSATAGATVLTAKVLNTTNDGTSVLWLQLVHL